MGLLNATPQHGVSSFYIQVTMHRPDEVPFVSKQWFRVPMDQESYVTITPKVTLTDNAVKRYNVER